ncbi:MAG: 4-hydroxythreonine-4-phosphate dehydrogenase PdxA [Rhodobacteraceae bacterium]|nr:4-hydroxythreonine-4-phosphate dehydrogenase PdxA [Paracoccaceae bacterium]
MQPLLPAKHKTNTSDLPLALTMGDPAGIGPEISCKAWESLHTDQSMAFFVIGDPALYTRAQPIESPDQAADIFKTALPVLPIENCAHPLNVTLGTPNETTAPAITGSIKMAVDLALKGQASAVVTNPIAKDVLYRAGFSFPGHTEYLADLTASVTPPYQRGPVMMLSAKDLRVALATIHIALKNVPGALSIDTIIHTVETVHGALKVDFGIENPRIAMAGLNPHAGENGALGREEKEILIPATEALRAQGIQISDPQSADTLFHAEAREHYDVVLAMYHDQGLIPVKTLDFHGGVNTTLGLPIIRTSPDHGTAFAIAGQGCARADSLIAAMKLAQSMARQRQNYG